MKKSFVKMMIVLFAAVILAVSPFNRTLAEDFTSQTMRLLHYEGDIVIEDANGKSRFVMENVRFKSGEAMATGENSLASVGMDDTKIVTLDQNTRVEFFKDGSQMLLKLIKGTILVDVREKLDENETLDVEISTMTVGIRGTVVKMTKEVIDGITFIKVTLLEGRCGISYTDENGKKKTVTVKAGYTAIFTYLDKDDKRAYSVEVRKTNDTDLEGFVNELMEKDPELKKRVLAARGQLEDENGENQPVGSPVFAPTTPPTESTTP